MGSWRLSLIGRERIEIELEWEDELSMESSSGPPMSHHQGPGQARGLPVHESFIISRRTLYS